MLYVRMQHLVQPCLSNVIVIVIINSHWFGIVGINANVDFSDKKIKDAFLHFHAKVVRANWYYCKPLIWCLWVVIFLVEYFKNEFKEVENVISGLGSLALLAFYWIMSLLVNKSMFLTKYAGLFLIFIFNVYMTEIIVQSGAYRIYEGYLAMIAFEFYIAIHLVIDVWYFPLTTFLGHTYLIIRFYTWLEDFTDVIIPSLYVPVIMQIFTWYTFNMHKKNDFLWMYTQSTTIDKFYKLLESFPERIVITQTKSDTPDEGRSFLLWVILTLLLHRCQNLIQQWWIDIW